MIQLVKPCRGHVTQWYGNIQPDGMKHTGNDYAYTDGTNTFPEVFAAADGVVLYAGDSRNLGWPNPWYFNPDFDRSDAWDSSAGNVLVIKHGNVAVTTYSHLESWTVKAGQVVRAGQRIATIGNTGNSYGKHLHFELLFLPHNFDTPTYGRTDPNPYITTGGAAIAPQGTTSQPTPKPTTKGKFMADLTEGEQREALNILRELRPLARDYAQGIPGVRADGDSFNLIRRIGQKFGVTQNEAARKAKYGKK